MKQYNIYYCGEETGMLIDEIKARNPKEAVRKILKEFLFEAKEIKDEK